MDYFKENNRYFVRIDMDEDLFGKLAEVASKEGWQSGHLVSGIGVLSDFELGYYDLEKKEYLKKSFSEEVELLSLSGNLSFVDGERFFHLHTVLAREDFSCLGGHLFTAKVGITCEICFETLGREVVRKKDDVTGLNLLSFN